MSIEVPKSLVTGEWIIDAEGEKKEVPRGPIRDLIDEVLAMPAPVAPLNTVKFPADFDLDDYWYGKPNLAKALDPKKKFFRWDLIDDSNWDANEREEA